MKKKKYFLIIIMILILLLTIAFLVGRDDDSKSLLPIDEIAKLWKGKQDLPSAGETKEISIPASPIEIFRMATLGTGTVTMFGM